MADVPSPLGAHGFAPGQWGVAQKLWLSFGLLLLIMAVSAVVSLYQVRQIDRALRQIVEIEEPLEQAVLEMEINAGETARAVLDYLRDLKPEHLAVMRDSEADFERYAAVFARLAETDEERRLGRRVAGLYTEFKLLGDQIIVLADRREASLQAFRTSTKAVDALLDEKLEPFANHTTSSRMGKHEAMDDMDEIVDEFFPLIASFLIYRDPAVRQSALGVQAEFDGLVARYREHGLSAEEAGLLARIQRKFNGAMETGMRIMAIVEELNERLQRFEEDLVAMDALLDDQIQPLIHAETNKAADAAQAATDQAVVALMVLGAIALMFGVAAAWTISRTILGPVRALAAGADAVGGGDLDHTIDIKSKDEFGRLAAAFNRMVGNLSRAMRLIEQTQEKLLRNERLAAIGLVTATVGHELRNPLGAIRSSLAVIKRLVRDENPMMKESLEISDRGITRCDAIISDLLDFTRIRELSPEPTVIDRWLRTVVEEHDLPAPVRLRLELAAGIEMALDRERLRRVVVNLIDNACHAMDANDPAGDRAPLLTVGARVNGERLEIIVRDTGCGMAPEAAAKAFEPLYSTKAFGVGLGLPLVRRIIEQHGGGVDITSQEERGTEVVLWLPLAVEKPGDAT